MLENTKRQILPLENVLANGLILAQEIILDLWTLEL